METLNAMNPTTSNISRATVFIIDDHELFSATLRDALELVGDFKVIGTSCDGTAALEQLAKTPADIVLLDLILPGLCGCEVAMKIRSLFPHTKIVVCSGVDSDAAIEMAFTSGAHVFVAKQSTVDELLKALRLARDGQCYLTARQGQVLRDSVRRRASKKTLAAQDISILRQFGRDHTAKEIAADAGLSLSCVYKARRRILERVGSHGSGAMQALAVQLGVVDQTTIPSSPVAAAAERSSRREALSAVGTAGAKIPTGSGAAAPVD
jgi:two-component system NarL family response regulator